MDRSETNLENETSIVCLLDSIKHVLATTERRCFMGANRQNIDVSFTIFSTTREYENNYKFINELFFVPLHGGMKYSFRRVFKYQYVIIQYFLSLRYWIHSLTIIYTYLAGFHISELNTSILTHGKSSHVRIMHYSEEGKCNHFSIKIKP